MRRGIFVGFLVGLGLLAVLDAVAARIGLAPGVIPKIAGASPWITSRAAGVTAFVALTLDVVFGLLLSTGVADRRIPRGRNVEIHRWLSSVALSLIAVHALALSLDRFVRFDVLDLLVPFLSSYRPFATSAGLMAAYGAIIVHATFGLRRRIGIKTWRKIHYASFFVFSAAIAHGLLAGSDSGASGGRGLYIAAGVLVTALGVYRALGSGVRRRPRSAPTG